MVQGDNNTIGLDGDLLSSPNIIKATISALLLAFAINSGKSQLLSRTGLQLEVEVAVPYKCNVNDEIEKKKTSLVFTVWTQLLQQVRTYIYNVWMYEYMRSRQQYWSYHFSSSMISHSSN